MVEIALDSDLAPKQHEIVSTVYREAEHLLTLINDVLDFSKLESARVELEMIPFDLKVLLEDISRGFALRAERSGLEFINVPVPCDAVQACGRPRQAEADPHQPPGQRREVHPQGRDPAQGGAGRGT
jgi:signal transduction histidine kinase